MLDISRLELTYEGGETLRFPALKVLEKGMCLITGRSGCGKTSLLFAIAGLLTPKKGHVRVDGTDIYTLSEAERDRFRGEHLGFVFQNIHLVKSLTVFQNVLLTPYFSGAKHARSEALDILEAVGLADKAHAMPETLSHGQSQRVAIARAVVHRPKLILADEPTSSLDDDSCKAVVNLLKKTAKDVGATLVVSSHDARITSQFKQRIALGDLS